MKHLIIVARPTNPKHETFTHAIAHTLEKATIEAGSEVRIRDLYQLGFDPILSSDDLSNLASRAYADDIKAEQAHIAWADIITFVYPIWWTGMPAILKGYVDRVFANGFAFGYGENGAIKMLEGKKGFLFSTSGYANDVYEQIGMHKSMQQTTDDGIFEFCGIEVIKHVFFGAIPYSTEEDRKRYLEEASDLIKANL